ncbi:MAG: glycosyltransferase family 4 protein [Bacteroidales bacterium]|nr:glycosyltransferase family 4 protein [Bacteroidales bacterium]
MLFYTAILILSFFLTWIFRKIAIQKSIIDIPNTRSSHSVPTPRGGGIAIAITWFLSLMYLYFSNKIETNLLFALSSGIILVIISLLDDIYTLKPILRFSFQFITAFLALYFIGGLKSLDLAYFKIDNIWILTPIAFISIIWFINLFNFLDGIDGYASMETIFLSLSMFYFTDSNIYIILAVATLGFLFWNWQPAKIFMGDVGSTLLGFNLIILSLYFQNTKTISLTLFIILSSLFWFDATLTLFRRWKNGENLTEAHKKHAYQRIVQYGFSHKKTTLYALFINIILFLISIISANTQQYIMATIFSVILLYAIIFFIDKKFPFS